LQQDRRGGEAVYAISGSGMLHFLNVHNGADVEPAVKFLPPGTNAVGLLTLQGGTIYAVTASNCGGAPSAVWVMNRPTKEVNKWESKSPIAGSAGAAVGGDGSLFVATEGGEIVHLAAKTLQPVATYSAPGAAFNSTPVVFLHGSKTLLAATTKTGELHVVDASDMKRAAEPAKFTTAADFTPGALASWQDNDGTRWLLAPSPKGVTSWKLTDMNGAASLQSGWVSREIARPLTPVIVNGVVFATSTGKAAPATLYALDGKTGKELWNSGKTITSFVQGGGLAAAAGQVYLPTYDGTLYAFGFPIEH
jgi:outer membrane protein assembly factor BamB